ncbi:MAG TPA: hypothetical protein VN327_10380 [Pseudonocardiaceae bacterium]|nr:hypothetical protein [Pseudonocardiaceae bacterium]
MTVFGWTLTVGAGWAVRDAADPASWSSPLPTADPSAHHYAGDRVSALRGAQKITADWITSYTHRPEDRR